MDKNLLVGRRAFLVCVGTGFVGACTEMGEPNRFESSSRFAEIEVKLGGRIGVAALDTQNGARLSHRGKERFAMCSSFKWILAARVLAGVDRGEIALNQRISYSTADLIDFSPVTKAHVGEGSLPVSDLCAAAVEVSDNTAANLLLSLVGGPQSLTGYLRRLGDPMTRLDRNELSLNTNIPGDERDTTTPNALIETMSKVLVGDALSRNGRERLIGWMKNCRTGLDRLRAGLPRDWTEGDKTGTGMNGAAVDNAIIWPPERPPILVAAYLSESLGSPAVLNAALAQIGGIVASAFG